MKRVCLMAAVGSVDVAKWCSRPSDGRQMSRTELGTVALDAPPEVVRTIGYVLTEAGRQAAGLASVAACAAIVLEGLLL